MAKYSVPLRAGCQGITGEIPASDQGAPRKRAVLTDRERERPCEECFQYSGKNAEKGHCARRDGGAGGGYRGHPHHLPVR